MSLLEKIESIENNASLNINTEEISNLLERGYALHKKFNDEITNFVDEFKTVAKTKKIDNDLLTLDGMLFLKDLVEINYSFCFDDFDKKSLTALPLFFVSFEKTNGAIFLEKLIPNICNFANEIEFFLKKHSLSYGGYVVFGEKRFVSTDLEVSRFITVEEFGKIIDDAEILLNKYLPLFIEDLENFVINKAFSLTLPDAKEENKRISFLREAIINVENYLSELKESDIMRKEINEIIDSLESLKKKEGNI